MSKVIHIHNGSHRMKPGTDLTTPKPFNETDITITLTGAEWFAFMARTVGADNPRYKLSPLGAQTYRRACDKLCAQILIASSACKAAGGQ